MELFIRIECSFSPQWVIWLQNDQGIYLSLCPWGNNTWTFQWMKFFFFGQKNLSFRTKVKRGSAPFSVILKRNFHWLDDHKHECMIKTILWPLVQKCFRSSDKWLFWNICQMELFKAFLLWIHDIYFMVQNNENKPMIARCEHITFMKWCRRQCAWRKKEMRKRMWKGFGERKKKNQQQQKQKTQASANTWISCIFICFECVICHENVIPCFRLFEIWCSPVV